MGKFNQDEFNQFVLDNRVIGFFEKPVTLKSGRQSHWYVNWRTVTEDACFANRLVDFVLGFAEDNGIVPDTFYGVPEGATKLGILTQNENARRSPRYSYGSHVLAMGRGQPKEHGAPKDRYFLGQPRGSTVIIEDVTTTGGSLIKTIDALAEAQIPVRAAIGLTNRMELRGDGKSVEQAVAEKKIIYLHMSDAVTLLPKAYQIQKPSDEVVNFVEKEFREVGLEPLKLR